MKQITLDYWVFAPIFGIVVFYVRSLVAKLDKVIENQNTTNQNIVKLILNNEHCDKRHLSTEKEIVSIRDRVHKLSNEVTILKNRKP